MKINMTRRKKILIIVAAIFVLLVISSLLIINKFRNDTYDAYAVEWVAGHIIRYLETHDGAWPKNWSDLQPIHEQLVREGKCPWSFEMLKERVVVDWDANPIGLASMPEKNDGPPFRVVYLRNGQDTHWQNMEPNTLIHKWLLGKRDGKKAPGCNDLANDN